MIYAKNNFDYSIAVGYTVISNQNNQREERKGFYIVFQDQIFGMPIVSAKVGNYGSGFVHDIMACTQDPDALVSKQALCRLFECSGRTVQRMVARRDLPPPIRMAGRKYWTAGTLGKWLSDAAKRRQAEIEAESRRLRAMMAERWRN